MDDSPLAEDAIRRVPLQAGVAWFWLCLAFRWEQPWEVRPWCKCGGGTPGWAGLSVSSDPTAGSPEGERSSHLHGHHRPRPHFLTPSFFFFFHTLFFAPQQSYSLQSPQAAEPIWAERNILTPSQVLIIECDLTIVNCGIGTVCI